MTEHYFERVHQETPTRAWINNPSGEELRLSIEAGAVAGTTNPAYGSKLLKKEPAYMREIIHEALQASEDDMEAADLIYRRVTRRFAEAFRSIHAESGGQMGFVTMQDDPRRDHDPELIVKAAFRHREAIGANFMAKIPVTETGLAAMADLVKYDMPMCATECFSIAQARVAGETYVNATRRHGKTPRFVVTHITGIYDEEIQEQVKRRGISLDPEMLRFAGTVVARKQYRMLKQRRYPILMLGGGVRDTIHFTEWVGGDAHVTMNWSTFEELIKADPPVESRMDALDSQEMILELSGKLEDFARAHADDGLEIGEFEPFAPLQRFRNNFIAGCDDVLREVAISRETLISG